MTSPWSAAREGAPIDAEFETNAASHARARSRTRPAAKRSRNITSIELVTGCVAAAIAGAVAAIAVVGSGSGVSTGPMAIDLAALKRSSAELAARNSQDAESLAVLRARIDAEADRIAAREAADLNLREELAALAAQVSALSGAGAGKPGLAGASAAMSPIGVLLARIEKLEGRAAADSAQPQTGPQLQRALQDMSGRLAALDAANAAMGDALGKQGQTIARLDASLAGALVASPARPATPAGGPAAATALAAPQPRLAEALARLEDAARSGYSFASQQGQLASLAPLDPDIAALATIARSGAPNAEQLRRSFEAIARPITDRLAARTLDDGLNWLRTAMSGVALERADGLRPLAAARTALGRNDLAAAADAGLPPEFAAWRETVRRRRQLDMLLERLHAR